jgi:hypothetical protein
MSTFEKHCQEAECQFGRPFEEVHRWLDEFRGTLKYGMRHRRVRHHEAGVQQAKALFGEAAAKVARKHIIADLKEEGWTETDPFPRDEQHYVAMGLF